MSTTPSQPQILETSLALATKFKCHGLVGASAFVIALMAMISGCSQSADLAAVEGRVTYNGQPLKFGTVMFQNVKGGQPAIGMIQPDGSFKLATPKAGDGVRPGNYEVAVSCYENHDPSKAPVADRGDMSPGKSLVPQKYMTAATSGLTAEVKPEGNEPIVLELTD